MKKGILATIFLSFFCISGLQAQLSEREKFLESLYLMDEKRFMEAMPLLEELLESNPENANLHYNLGVALSNSFRDEDHPKAMTHFEQAIQNVSPNYTPFSPREKKAPVDAFYYYARALHSEAKFDEAIANYKKFETYINDKHYLYDEVENRIQMAEYAKTAVEDPREIKIVNLGENVNSIYPEYSPAIRIDESAIYFTSRRLRPDSSNLGLIDPVDGMYYEDIYVSFNDNGVWSEPRQLNISTSGNEATLNLSVDGKTLFIYKGEEDEGTLYESRLVSDSAGIEEWSKPKRLGSNINTKARETHVTISPDERTLYFTSDREGGEGGMDIYFCRLLPTGKWADAVNMGPRINTKFNEDGVFMHPDGKTLYFSSNGHPSIGGYDIVFATKSDTGWTVPENMGYPVNSVDDDIFFVTTPDGKRAYFSSFKEGGIGEKDLYMIQLIDAAETALTLYRGEFTYANSTSPPDGALVTITNNYTGEMVGVYTPRQRDGQFSAILAPNSSYHFVYEANDFETYEEDIYVPEGASYQEIYKDIKLKPVRVSSGMAGIIPAALAKATVNGSITANDTVVRNQKIILTDEQGNVIYESVTNDQGGFNFKDLDPSKTYIMKLVDNDKASFLVYEMDLVNDRGEEVVYARRDNKSVVFVPSKYPYEFYGISARELAGTVRGKDGPVEGLTVRLEDDKKTLIQQETTDKYGEFNFKRLSLDKKYRLVFDGEFPEDPIITITNEFGEELTFKRVADGVFEYVPSAGKKAQGSVIAGTFRKDNTPISGVKVLLKDDNSNILQQNITDDKGNFVFSNLDLDNRYKLVFEGDFPDDPSLVLTNEYGEELTFRRTAEGVYEYIPNKAGQGSEIKGVVSKNGRPISGLGVKLLNGSSSELIQQTETDNKGEFNFASLDLDQSYRIQFDGDFPDNPDMILLNEFGQELRFQKVGDGLYEYIPGRKSKQGTQFNGSITSAGKAIPNMRVRLQNDQGETYQQTETDAKGNFNFKNLDLNQSYVLLLDGEIDDLKIVVTNEYGQQLTFVKTGEGRYEYIPEGKSKKGSVISATAMKDGKPLSGFSVNLRDAKGEIIETQKTDDKGNFRFTQLNLDRRYQIEFLGAFPDGANIVFTNEFGEELTFMQVKKGVYEFVPRPIGFPLKSYTLGVKDEIAYKDTYPQPKELKDVIVYFQKYFPYNAKDINEQNKEFKSFISDIADIVKKRGFAQIIITSSASKVPTRTWKSNSILTKRRAYDTKRLLEKVFKAQGLSEDEFNFVDINTLITGPDYRNDPIKNKSTYEKHQYVRIFIK